MRYIIHKGWHYSWPLFKVGIDFIGRHTNQQCSVKVVFNETNMYDFDGSWHQYDCNKLFGYSQGHHHDNSVRTCWVWHPEDGMIHLCYYAYENGNNLKNDTSLYADVCKIPLGLPVKISLMTKRLDRNSVEDTMIVYDRDFIIGYHTHVRRVDDSFKFGYYMTPYFGGVMKCPHKMHIDMEWL